MDARAALARQYHQASINSGEEAGQHRAQRDQLIRQLRAEDPLTWTYDALAKAVGCSPELIAYIVKNVPAQDRNGFAADQHQ